MQASSEKNSSPPASVSVYLVEAYNLYDSINIKSIRGSVTGRVLDSTTQELQIQYGDASFCFVYRFGCVVFFNVSKETREAEFECLRQVLGPFVAHPTSETFQVRANDGADNVEFEFVQLKKLTLDQVRIICVSVGQSAALEYFELEADRVLRDTSEIMNAMAKGAGLPMVKTKKLLSIIGATASARQHIINNIAILDPPDATWKSKELEKLHTEVQENFDIDMRFRILDRKLSLVQDNIEILADLSSTQRNTLLETLIAVLIIIELVVALFIKN